MKCTWVRVKGQIVEKRKIQPHRNVLYIETFCQVDSHFIKASVISCELSIIFCHNSGVNVIPFLVANDLPYFLPKSRISTYFLSRYLRTLTRLKSFRCHSVFIFLAGPRCPYAQNKLNEKIWKKKNSFFSQKLRTGDNKCNTITLGGGHLLHPNQHQSRCPPI